MKKVKLIHNSWALNAALYCSGVIRLLAIVLGLLGTVNVPAWDGPTAIVRHAISMNNSRIEGSVQELMGGEFVAQRWGDHHRGSVGSRLSDEPH